MSKSAHKGIIYLGLTDRKVKNKRLAQQDARLRNAVDGKFGEGKRRYGHR
jgi:hypothetical protein